MTLEFQLQKMEENARKPLGIPMLAAAELIKMCLFFHWVVLISSLDLYTDQEFLNKLNPTERFVSIECCTELLANQNKYRDRREI